jgi:GLUG motif-containing protein
MMAKKVLGLGCRVGPCPTRCRAGRIHQTSSFSLLALILFFTFYFLLLTCSYADYADGDGSPEFPYEIAEPNQLIYMSQHLEHWSQHFLLTADLNMNLADPNTFTTALIAWDTDDSTSGFQGTPFTGTFDGNGHTISTLTVNGVHHCGLFGYIDHGGSIMNLGLENVSITSSGVFVGGLVGLNGGSVTDSYSTGSVKGGFSVGGLIGYNWIGSITNSYSTVSVSAIYDNVGGLVGYNYVGGIITDSNSTGSVNGRSYVGGLVGYNYYCSITGSNSTGSVKGSSYVGGLLGWNSGSVNSCYFTGEVTGVDYVAGLVGSNGDWGNPTGSITNCYSTAIVTGSGKCVGGLVGWNTQGSITESYSTGSFSGHHEVGGLVGYNGGSIADSYSTGLVRWESSVDGGGLVGVNAGSITRCYSTGSVNDSWGLCGLVGHNYPVGSITGSFWDIDTSGATVSDGGIGQTTEDMKTISTFTNIGWDFVGEEDNGNEDYWQLCIDGYDYPRLTWQFSSPGDFLHPGRVDHYDLLVLAHDWLYVDSRCGDIGPGGGDGMVNLFDYIEFSRYWLFE